MAALLQLVRGNDNLTTGSTFNLLDYTNGFNVAYGGWLPTVSEGTNPDLVSETITLRVRPPQNTALPVDNVAVGIQALDDRLRQAGEYFDGEAELYGVWLQARNDGETNTRQALIRRGRTAPQSSLFSVAGKRGVIPEYILALERFPWWEALSSVTGQVNGVNCLGGMGLLPVSASGDTKARICFLSVQGMSLRSSTAELDDIWIGFRTDHHGARANLKTVWDLGNASVTMGTDTARTSDGTAYGGYKAQCSFATTASMAARTTASLGGYTSNYEDQRGEYTVLLRAKVGSSTCCYARLLSGYDSGSAYDYRDRVKIESTSWKLYDMGTVTIPPFRFYYPGTPQSGFAMRVQVERTGGTTLDLDCLVLIPRSEGFVYTGNNAVRNDRNMRVICSPAGHTMGLCFTYPDVRPIVVSQSRFALPPGACSVVVAGQESGQHNLTDTVNVAVSFYNRWRTLRGAE